MTAATTPRSIRTFAPAARGDAWRALLARWDVAAGSDSERALAAAVLADAPRHTAAERRAATAVLRRSPTPYPGHIMPSPITPYLIFDGDCRAAMTRYQQLLGGELTMSTYGESGQAGSPETADWIIHARLSDGTCTLLASDRHPAVPFVAGHQMQLMYELPSVEAMERAYAALADGGEATVPPHDAFWGARFGMLRDRFGTHWMLAHTPALAEV